MSQTLKRVTQGVQEVPVTGRIRGSYIDVLVCYSVIDWAKGRRVTIGLLEAAVGNVLEEDYSEEEHSLEKNHGMLPYDI